MISTLIRLLYVSIAPIGVILLSKWLYGWSVPDIKYYVWIAPAMLGLITADLGHIGLTKWGNQMDKAKKEKLLAIVILFLLFIVITVLVYKYFPVNAKWKSDGSWNVGVDWKTAYKPAILAIFSGKNPYQTVGYFLNPPWALLPFMPLAFVPDGVGSAVMFTLSLFGFGYAAYRFGAKKPLVLVAFLMVPQVLSGSSNGAFDWLVGLGCTLPPQIGIFFVLSKPQIGFGVAIYWLIDALQTGGIRQAVKVFWPVIAALFLSFVLFGLWPLTSLKMPTMSANMSLFPLSLPFGLALLFAAIKRKNLSMAVMSSPLLSPYMNATSWSIAVFALAPYPAEFVISSLAMYIIRFYPIYR